MMEHEVLGDDEYAIWEEERKEWGRKVAGLARRRRADRELRSYNYLTGEYELGPKHEPPNPFEPQDDDDDEVSPELLKWLKRRRKSHPDFRPFRFHGAVVRYMREPSDLAARLRVERDRLLLEINMDPDILAQSPRLIERLKAEIIRLRLDPPTGLGGCAVHARSVGKR